VDVAELMPLHGIGYLPPNPFVYIQQRTVGLSIPTLF
jgi:hypothetical protein